MNLVLQGAKLIGANSDISNKDIPKDFAYQPTMVRNGVGEIGKETRKALDEQIRGLHK